MATRTPPEPASPYCPLCGLKKVRWDGCDHPHHDKPGDRSAA